MPNRRYDQYCGIAAALDVVGDRWSLLILRELLIGEQRFTDLRRELPGIPPNLLTDRLRQLEEVGLVTRRELPPPAARTVYAITDEGRKVRPVLMSLARFGVQFLGPAPDDLPPERDVFGALTPWHDAEAGRGVREHYRIVEGGRAFDVFEDDGHLRRPPPGSEPALVVSAPQGLFFEARRGAGDTSVLTYEGSDDSWRRFRRIFQLND